MPTPYQLLYRVGFTPWDGKTWLSPLDDLIAVLPPGIALDLGCGTGHHSVKLAQHGWTVVGVDVVQPALDAARARAEAAGVEVELVKEDGRNLGAALADRRFDLVIDFGCVHGMSARGRRKTYDALTRLTAPGATFLLLAVLPRRGIGPHGFDEKSLLEEIGSRWALESTMAQEALAVHSPLGSSPFQWYVLRRQ